MHVVTGAFGYIGKYIARRLLRRGEKVRTITTHPERPNPLLGAGPFAGRVEARPYHFDQPDKLTDWLRGAKTLFNTYWIRFEHGEAKFEQAVQNTLTLFECARAAGVAKIVHISVTHATDSELPYYRGKAEQERALAECGVPYSIVRPTLVFGVEDILVNNIAWLVRKSPIFTMFGDGRYRIQPVFVDDVARIAIESAELPGNPTVDAIGPETFAFEGLVRLIMEAVNPSMKIIRLPPIVGLTIGKLIGWKMKDVILTRDELQGLMDELLISTQAPNGTTKFSEWITANRKTIGNEYTSEVARHFQ
jgi:NADH dehydrogenase